MPEDHESLAGGGQNYGRLRRVGDTVIRPVGDHSSAVQAFLLHLEAQGFDGAPRLVSTSDSEEVLGFIDGEVPAPPEPPDDGWPVVSDARAASVARLLARFHAASRSFVPPADARWNGGFTPGLQPSIVCHNDPVVGNLVFRGEDAVGLIDFDFAGPNDPLWDLAIAAQHWVPLADPIDLIDLIDAPRRWSAASRLAAMSRAYGLGERSIDKLLDLVDLYLERGRRGVLSRVQAGEERFIAYWDAGLGDRLLRALVWLRAQRAALA